jgi:hypothetical protein
MQDQVLATLSYCDSLELFAVTLICTYSKLSFRISGLQKYLMIKFVDSQTMLRVLVRKPITVLI